MAEISLRAYTQEIDGLIELERLDEAIAHCRQILQAYPKHLDTYRLLGKAYLEAKRYGDASDIFQRVLSSEPADFVAHIGMSVIREDEENLDTSIWHMERAFETNPANQVIQQELKRLFGQRDGFEPTKVRLTRGALARMYANGDLFPQAIAELRAALQEDQERPDLQIMLAEMYWRTNQPLEAAEICSQILDGLPHCREANRIMAAVLQGSGRSDAAAPYLRRIAAIDPYSAFLESPAQDPARVDADSIKLEKLDWQPGAESASFIRNKPDWAMSLGAELSAEEQVPEDTPPWLDALSSASAAASEESGEKSALEPTGADGGVFLPDWMLESGWDEATGDAEEPRLSFSDEELKQLEEGIQAADEIEPAQIPDWLRDIAPDEASEEEVIPAESEAEGERVLPDWLQGIADDVRRSDEESDTAPLMGDSQFAVDELDGLDRPMEEALEDQREIPTWLDDAEPGSSESIVSWLGSRIPPSSVEQEDLQPPDEAAKMPISAEESTISWLGGMAAAAAKEEEEEQALVAPEFEEGEFPLTREEASLAATRELSPDSLEEFFRARESEAKQPASEVDEPEPSRWTPEFEAPEPGEPAPAPQSEAEEVEFELEAQEPKAWLERLSEEMPASAAPAPPPEEEAEVPDWLRTLAADTGALDPVGDIAEGASQPSEQIAEPQLSVDEMAPSSRSQWEPTTPEAELPDEGEPISLRAEEEIAVPEIPVEEEPLRFEPEPAAEAPTDAEPPRFEPEPAVEAPADAKPLRFEPEPAAEAPTDAEPLRFEPEPVAEAPAEAEPPRFEPEPTIEAPADAELSRFEPEPAAEAPAYAEPPRFEPEPAAEVPADAELSRFELEPAAEAPADAELSRIELEPAAEAPADAEPPRFEPEPAAEAPSDAEPPRFEPEPAAEALPDDQPAVPIAAPSPPVSGATKRLSPEQASLVLEQAKQAIEAGDIDAAAQHFAVLVKKKRLLTEVIEQVENALQSHPGVPELWQVLGDAHMKADQLPEAMEAYRSGLDRI